MDLRSRQILLVFGDIFLLYFSLFIALSIGFWKNFSWEIFFWHLLPFSILYLLWLIIFYIFDLYSLNLIKKTSVFYPRFLTSLFINLLVGMAFFYLIPIFGITPKTNLVINIFIFGILSLIWRWFFYFLFSAYFLHRVAILGKNPQGTELVEKIVSQPHLGYQVIPLDFNQDLLSQIETKKIDILIIAETLNSNPKLVKNLYQCLSAQIRFLDLSQAYEIICEKIPIFFINQIWFLENLQGGEKKFFDKIKRIIDLCLSFALILATLPFWPLIALAIKLEDGGPIFYRQERVGKDNRKFILYKFRSMVEEAEKEGPRWAQIKDERITKVGKFLRNTHLDEIPQLFNVLKGELSLVGPRPERPEFVEQLEKEIPHYRLRHLIRPGITGWAQIKFRYGRSISDSVEKFQYDLYYIKNRSLFLDLRILLKTFQLFFKKD